MKGSQIGKNNFRDLELKLMLCCMIMFTYHNLCLRGIKLLLGSSPNTVFKIFGGTVLHKLFNCHL